jgi:hypothetical protein
VLATSESFDAAIHADGTLSITSQGTTIRMRPADALRCAQWFTRVEAVLRGGAGT